MEKLVEVCKCKGRMTCPAFAMSSGNFSTIGDYYDAVFWKYLSAVQACTDLIDRKVDVDVYISLDRIPM